MADKLWPTVSLLLLLGSSGTVAADLGTQLYFACMTCHGDRGQGSFPMDAPRIAGMESWYVADQLKKFRSGARGDHPDDIYGRQMVLFAKALPDEAAIDAVAAYISQLDAPPNKPKSAGNADRGKTLYVSCAACHGQEAEGQPNLAAPALVGLDDWYVERQLQNYRSGRRGNVASDPPGQQMRAAANVLADDQSVRDVAAFIATR